MRKFGIFGAALLGGVAMLAACQPQTSSPTAMDYANRIDAENIRAHIEFLADDLMRGRDTGADEYEIAANYVATYMKLMGFKPGNGDSYMQEVPFRKSSVKEMNATLTIDGEEMKLEPMKDFVLGGSYNALEESARGEIVFAGYGIHAPDFGYSDYENIDVEGKYVMMVRRGAPEGFPSDERAYFSSTDHKMSEAIKRGAKGVLWLADPAWKERYSWERLARWAAGGGGMNWVAPDGSVPNAHPEIAITGMLSYDMGDKLFESAPQPVAETLEGLKSGEPQSFVFPASISASRTSEWEEIRSPNVVGILEGSDPELKDEYVLFSGHLDHVGVDEPRPDENGEIDENQDLINNGAYDNATGIGILLEVMRMYSEMETRPKRSIIFLAVTAEEKGLLGSEYWGANPTVDIDKVSANINIDMPVLTFPIADVVGYGVEHSGLHEIVAEKSGKMGLELSPDPWPEQVIFVRSDQYSFVKQGVPAVFLVPGFTSADPDINGEEAWRGFEKEHYHSPSDDLSLPFDMASAKKFAATNFLVGLEVANRDKRIEWKEGDFFGKQFGPLRDN